MPGSSHDIFSIALAPTLAGRMVLLGVLLLGCKLAAMVAQLWLARGDLRATPAGRGFKTVYWAGKITPALACFSLALGAWLAREVGQAWQFGLLGAAAAALALHVVRLRKAGRFFGLADAVSSRVRPRR